MDDDLRDLLAGYHGAESLSDDRETALLRRLKSDEGFRRTLAGELHLLGMLRAAQSAEPRWLELADALGRELPTATTDDELTRAVLASAALRRRGRLSRKVTLAAVLGLACTVALLTVAVRPWQVEVAPPNRVQELGRVSSWESVVWGGRGDAHYALGDAVGQGLLRLASGRIAVTFRSGVVLGVEGPAELEILSGDQVRSLDGKIRVRVPHGAEGFTVRSAGFEVVDPGTEFGLNTQPGGKSQLRVFEGQTAVSLLGTENWSTQSRLVETDHAVEVDPAARTIVESAHGAESFTKLIGRPTPENGPLALAPGYRRAVLDAEPWAYWRFESLVGGAVPNEVPGRPALAPSGKVSLSAHGGGNRSAVFGRGELNDALIMDGLWAPPRDDGFAIELWVQATPARPVFGGSSALVALVADRPDGPEGHVALVELSALGRDPLEPCAVRFLDRWPALGTGGSNCYSRRDFAIGRWHHVVGQKVARRIELYVDGRLVGTTPSGDDDGTADCRLLVGRLKQFGRDTTQIRPFDGQIDELALYPRPLPPGVIRAHAELGNGSD